MQSSSLNTDLTFPRSTTALYRFIRNPRMIAAPSVFVNFAEILVVSDRVLSVFNLFFFPHQHNAAVVRLHIFIVGLCARCNAASFFRVTTQLIALRLRFSFQFFRSFHLINPTTAARFVFKCSALPLAREFVRSVVFELAL